MELKLEKYNNDLSFCISRKKNLNLFMFIEACLTASHIARNLTIENGHCLILGSGGKGRNNLARLGIYLANLKMFDEDNNVDYNDKIWNDDLKKTLMVSGLERQEIGFLISDKRLNNEKMLDDINNVLLSGEIVGLYNEKDVEEILSQN